MSRYTIWDKEPNDLVGDFATEEEALRLVRYGYKMPERSSFALALIAFAGCERLSASIGAARR